MIIKQKEFTYIKTLNKLGGIFINFIETVKNILGINDNSYDYILNFILSDVKQFILNYCNIDKLPIELNFTFINMTVEKYKNYNKYLINNDNNIKSISEGDISITYHLYNSGVDNYSIFDKFLSELNIFRKIKV